MLDRPLMGLVEAVLAMAEVAGFFGAHTLPAFQVLYLSSRDSVFARETRRASTPCTVVPSLGQVLAAGLVQHIFQLMLLHRFDTI